MNTYAKFGEICRDKEFMCKSLEEMNKDTMDDNVSVCLCTPSIIYPAHVSANLITDEDAYSCYRWGTDEQYLAMKSFLESRNNNLLG